MSVKLVSYSKDYLSTILGAISQCHGKPANAKVLESVISSGHLSVLEHAMATFEIQCSLAVLGQITRHRHLSFTVKSTRVAEFGGSCDIPEDLDFEQQRYFMHYYGVTVEAYEELIDRGVSRESAAYLLPKATMTSMYVSGNLRAWLEYLPHRLCSRALPEHRDIAARIHSELTLAIPEIFNRELKRCNRGCTEKSCKFGVNGGKQ
jgi:thymidylate synthase (FAD)